MLAKSCTFRAALPLRSLSRTYATTQTSPTNPRPSSSPAALSTSSAQPFSNPLVPNPNTTKKNVPTTTALLSREEKLGNAALPDGVAGVPPPPKKSTFVPPISIVPEGGVLKGLNYLKGREDPVALAEAEYPEWLWGCLEKKVEEGESFEGDEFSKSKKVRQAAAKRARKLEARMLAAGDTSVLEPKIPLTQQTIDLPSNEEGTLEGATKAIGEREKLRGAMRVERRKAIKTKNYLKGM